MYENMNEKLLTELIYDRLAGNTNYEMFEPERVGGMSLVDDPREDIFTIEIEIGSDIYELRTKKIEGGNE